MSATYSKLKSGNWGIRVNGTPKAGQAISVTKKSGETKTEVVVRVIWSGNGISLCAIQERQSSHSSGRGRGHGGRYECDECGDYVYPGSSCWETGMVH